MYLTPAGDDETHYRFPSTGIFPEGTDKNFIINSELLVADSNSEIEISFTSDATKYSTKILINNILFKNGKIYIKDHFLTFLINLENYNTILIPTVDVYITPLKTLGLIKTMPQTIKVNFIEEDLSVIISELVIE